MIHDRSGRQASGARAARWSESYAAICFWAALAATPFLSRLTDVLLLLTTVLFYFVCRYAKKYMHGDPGQTRFAAWLCAAGSCVFALVLAGNLLLFAVAWSATSLCLQQLLEFYPERPNAILAARKKFLISRLSEICLVGALVLTNRIFHTWDFNRIFAAAGHMRAARPQHLPASFTCLCMLLILAALMKSAQFPFHTWLPDTMETPTPVSALMHAGIINAGGILVIRLSPLLSLSDAVMLILALFGAFTALFASVVMWTQASVKRCLAFSTVSQMGFMMLECGLGAFHLALLHLVAHSFYKAHAFLSSGGAVSAKTPDRRKQIRPLTIVLGLAGATATGIAACQLTGIPVSDQPLLTGIFVIALAQMLWTLWSPLNRPWLAPIGIMLGAGFSAAYFGLERTAAFVIPPLRSDHLVIVPPILAGFFLVVMAQTHLPWLSGTSIGKRLYVHARNGFYFNALANRFTMALWPIRPK